MKHWIAIGFFSISFAASSQGNLGSLLVTGDASIVSKESAHLQLQHFMQRLPGSKVSEEKLLRKTFHRLHSTFLKKFEAYSPLSAAFASGRYDCLTGTALFSLVLDQLKYSYDIVETNYHIFIIVHTSRGEVLLETTDRLTGFVTNAEEIANRIAAYQKNQPSIDNSKKFTYTYSFNLYQKISPDKLTGLLYFNQAVKAYNNKDWVVSSKLLEKANMLYPSPRCEALGGILIQTVLESSLKEKAKTECLVHLRNFWMKKSENVASN